MTAHRRPLLVFAVALLLPACLHFDSPTPFVPTADQAAKTDTTAKTDSLRKTQFAELTSRPGSIVYTKPNASAVSSQPIDGGEGVVVVEKKDSPAIQPAPAPTPSPDPPLLAAVRAYAERKPEKAIEILSALDKPNQDLVLAVLPILERGATLDLRGDPAATAILADQLRNAAARIESRAALRLDVVALCRRVEGYGRYEPRPNDLPYRPNDLAQIYIEVKNLVSQPAAGAHGESYVTHARYTVEIRDSYGKLVDQQLPDRRVSVVQSEKKLLTHTPIHEFYLLYEFPAPAAPGVYNITVNIQDAINLRRSIKTEPVQFTVAVN